MLEYFVMLFIYLTAYSFSFLLTGSIMASLLAKLAAMAAVLYFFRDKFPFRIKFDFISILSGFVIFIFWVGADGYYPLIGPESPIIYYSVYEIILKFIISVAIAPVAEEFFTRFFLMRWIISKDWQKVPIGKYTFTSFIVTVLFFGLSHSRWLAGIMAGILLNVLLYKKKTIESVILAHAAANFFLGIFVIATGNYQFW